MFSKAAERLSGFVAAEAVASIRSSRSEEEGA